MNRIQALCGVLRNAEADAMLLTGEVNLVYATSVTNLEGSCLLFPDETVRVVCCSCRLQAGCDVEDTVCV